MPLSQSQAQHQLILGFSSTYPRMMHTNPAQLTGARQHLALCHMAPASLTPTVHCAPPFEPSCSSGSREVLARSLPHPPERTVPPGRRCFHSWRSWHSRHSRDGRRRSPSGWPAGRSHHSGRGRGNSGAVSGGLSPLPATSSNTGLLAAPTALPTLSPCIFF
jgi:hypothetical protein